MKTAFIIMSIVVLSAFFTVLVFAIKLVKKYRKDKANGKRTDELKAEIDRLLELDEIEFKTYHT